MLYETVEESGTGPARTWTPAEQRDTKLDWRTVDRTLRRIRRSRAALDAEEARWLREAEALQIWRHLGMVSALDYLERVLDYAPRTAQERLRVARALGDLPRLTTALAGGDLGYSAVRELTRVATPTTEASWIAAALDKNLRQIEELVADHRPGDRPDDPPDPQARTHVVRFELSAQTFALLRQARTVVDDEHGTNLADDAFVAALCSAVLDGTPATEPTGRAKFQIAVTVCERCRRGWQDGAGAKIAIDPPAVERAMCDAQHIGSIDGAAPERAYQDIPPSVARLVWRRDGGRCRVPGCRSARGLELHHLIHREDGGSHDARNLVLVCSACHLAHHRGMLRIVGTADQLEVRRPGQTSQPAAPHDQPNGSATGVPTKASSTTAADSPGSTATTIARAAASTRTHVNVGPAVSTVTSARAPVGASPSTNAGLPVSASATASPVTTTRPVTSTRAPVGASPSTGTDVSASETISSRVDPRSAAVAITNPAAHVDVPSASSPIHRTGAHGGSSSTLDTTILRTQAKAALTGLGWKPAVARAAVAAAAAAQGTDVTLEQLIFESLRRCPAPEGVSGAPGT